LNKYLPFLLLILMSSPTVVLVQNDAGAQAADGSVGPTVHKDIKLFVSQVPGSEGGGFEPHIAAGPGIDGTEWIYIDSPTGWLGGQSGNLWISKDHGETWEPHPYGRNAGGSGDSYTAIAKDGTIYYTDLYLWSSTIDTSKDGGETWIRNPLATKTRVGDRQWLAMGPTVGTPPGAQTETLYMIYNDIPLGLVIQRAQWSSRGMFWTMGNRRQAVTGSVQSRDHFAVDPVDGTIYLPNKDGGGIAVYVSTDGADTFSRYQVISSGDDANNIFIAADVDMLGNVYLTWSTQAHIFLARSQDKGVTWDVFQVTDTEGTRVFPWVVAGDPGRIALTWYDTPDVNGSSDEKTDAVWSVQGAISTDSFSDNVSFLITTIEPNVHTGAIRTTGTGGDSDRDLGDFFTCDVDEYGRLIVTYGKDGDDGPNARLSVVMFARQEEGPFLFKNTGPVAMFENWTSGLKVKVDGSRSYDMSGEGIVEYSWDWGDGENSTGTRSEHTYGKAGTYEITLRAKNKLGMIGWATGQVRVNEPKEGAGGMVLIIIPIALIAVGAGAYYLWSRKNRRPKKDDVR